MVIVVPWSSTTAMTETMETGLHAIIVHGFLRLS